jgi:hypothetical protein
MIVVDKQRDGQWMNSNKDEQRTSLIYLLSNHEFDTRASLYPIYLLF